MAGDLACSSWDLQRHGFLVAGIDGNVALDAHGGRVRHQDQTTFSAVNPGLVRRIGEGNMRETGEEGNVSEFEEWSG